MGSCRDPPRTQYCGDVEEQDIPESHFAAKLRDGISVWLGQAVRLRSEKKKIPVPHRGTGTPSLPDSWRHPLFNAVPSTRRLQPIRFHRTPAAVEVESQSAAALTNLSELH